LRIKESTYLKSSNLRVHVSASLGIATFPDDADNLTDLLARADQAMFSVKEGGKDSICGISPEEGDPPVNNCKC
jgi:predicted signal transduction protein with EAL and GGDEF domain